MSKTVPFLTPYNFEKIQILKSPLTFLPTTEGNSPTTFCSNFSRKSSCDYTFSKMQCNFSEVKN